MNELVAFLRRCLDEDERIALESPGPAWHRAIERDGEPGKWRGIKAQLVTLPPARPHPLLVGDEVASCANYWAAEHIARWDPARVLAEIQAKRAILDWAEDAMDVDDEHDTQQTAGRAEARFVLPLLAQPYAGQDGWREQWAA